VSQTLTDVKMYARVPFALQRLFAEKITLTDAQRIVRARMTQRTENFLARLELQVFANPHSPYRTLLQWAGCELGDVRAMVQRDGVEATLKKLRAAGVYVAFEEFKGRQPIVRGSHTLAVTPSDFENHADENFLTLTSGGSTGKPTPVAINVPHLVSRAPYQLLARAAFGVNDAPEILWRGILPDSTLSSILQAAITGHLPDYWYSFIGWRDSKQWLKYGAATYYILSWLRLYGMRVPFPKYVPPERAEVIARHAIALRDRYGHCYLHGGTSRGVRIAQAAETLGSDLRGVIMTGGGEPATEIKVKLIEKSGARFFSNYALTEAGLMANGCAYPNAPGDVHLYTDSYALITYPFQVPKVGVTVPAFNLTTLLPTAPMMLLNLQMDDYGIVEERVCGCEFEEYGFTTHLHTIRSYRKLTGEGVTLIGSDALKILEEVLPARYGGSALDYQWMEQEDAQGLTRLYLIIHPRIDIANEQEVIEFVMRAWRGAAWTDSAQIVWKHTDTLRVKRVEPVWTARGKLFPLQLERV